MKNKSTVGKTGKKQGKQSVKKKKVKIYRLYQFGNDIQVEQCDSTHKLKIYII